MSFVHFNGLKAAGEKGAKAKETNKEVPNWVLFLAPRSINCSPHIVNVAVIMSFFFYLYQGCWPRSGRTQSNRVFSPARQKTTSSKWEPR